MEQVSRHLAQGPNDAALRGVGRLFLHDPRRDDRGGRDAGRGQRRTVVRPRPSRPPSGHQLSGDPAGRLGRSEGWRRPLHQRGGREADGVDAHERAKRRERGGRGCPIVYRQMAWNGGRGRGGGRRWGARVSTR